MRGPAGSSPLRPAKQAARGEFDPELPDQPRQDQHGFCECEVRANANSGADPEGKIRVAGHRWGSRQKPPWIERVWLAPEPLVAVQNPGRDHDDVARGDLAPRHPVRSTCRTHNDEGRGIEAHRLIDHSSRQDEPSGTGCRVARLPLARDLGCNLVLHLGGKSKKVD